MQEDYLHYLWEFQKWNRISLVSTEGLPITVLSPGTHNFLSGPDFFNARVVVGEQEWAGNVEIHLKSSDWYFHSHEKDPAYDNVILHVVWEHDLEIFRRNNSALPVLELKNNVAENTLHSYRQLVISSSKRWINCERSFPGISSFQMENWLERLFFERLEKKSGMIFEMLKKSAGDWEEVLFRILARSFGLNTNGEAFLSIACSIPFSVIRKCSKKEGQLEALFLGQAGLLERDLQEPHFQRLQANYLFLKNKFGLDREGLIPVRYFRLRPDNFPEIRLAQLAAVYESQQSLFSRLMKISSSEEFNNLFRKDINEFWKTHYTFLKPHKPRKKMVSGAFLDLLLINSFIPVRFCYQKSLGKDEDGQLVEFLEQVAAENNSIVQQFNRIRPGSASNAVESQGLLELKKEYCDMNRCLKCAFGIKFLQGEEQI